MSKYKTVFIPKLGDSAKHEEEYDTHEAAEIARQAISNYTLKLHEAGLMPDYSNTGYVLKRDGDSWTEIDGDGNEI